MANRVRAGIWIKGSDHSRDLDPLITIFDRII